MRARPPGAAPRALRPALFALLVLCICVGHAAAIPWEQVKSWTFTPGSDAKPAGTAGLDPVCVCSVFAYSAPLCQAAANKHCKSGATGSGGFCKGMKNPKALASDASGAAASVARYLHDKCFPSEEVDPNPDYCGCFEDPYSRQCAVARVALCASGRSQNTCPGFTLGPGAISADRFSNFLQKAERACPGVEFKLTNNANKPRATIAGSPAAPAAAAATAAKPAPKPVAAKGPPEFDGPRLCSCAYEGYLSGACAVAAGARCEGAIPGDAFCDGFKDVGRLRKSSTTAAAVAGVLGKVCFTPEELAKANVCSCFEDNKSQACAAARVRACRDEDALCGALTLGVAASPVQTAYYDAAKSLGRKACGPATVTVSMLFEGVDEAQLKKAYADAAAGVVANILHVKRPEVVFSVAGVRAGARGASTSAAAAARNAATAATLTIAGAPAHASSPGSTLPTGRRLLAAGTGGGPGVLAIATFAANVTDRGAAQSHLTRAVADNGQQLYADLRKARVPFKPRAVAINGQSVIGSRGDTPLAAWDANVAGILIPLYGPGAAKAAPPAPKRGVTLPKEYVTGIAVGSALGGVGLVALAMTCCVTRRRQFAKNLDDKPRRRISDSAVMLPPSDIGCTGEETATKSGDNGTADAVSILASSGMPNSSPQQN